MFITEFNGIQYVFDQDRLYLNGFPLLYSDISNIAHRGGAQPAFIFDYKGRRLSLPYNPSELRSILPYFALARNTTTVAAPAPAPVEAAPAPEPYYQEMVPNPSLVEAAPAPEPYYQEMVLEPDPVEAVPDPGPYYQEEAFAPVDPETEFAPALDDPDTKFAPSPENLEPSLALPKEPKPEQPQKKKSSKKFIIIGAVILAALIAAAVIYFLGGSDEAAPQDSNVDFTTEEVNETDGEEVEDAAPTGGDFEATDGFSVADADGSLDVKLSKVYTGNDALQKAADMGEDQNELTDYAESGYKLVLYEYEVNVKEGSMVGDIVTGEMYMPDKKTEIDDCWSVDLTKNIDRDLSSGEIEIASGQTTNVYIAYYMPEDLKDYYEKVLINDDGTEIWVHYVLGN